MRLVCRLAAACLLVGLQPTPASAAPLQPTSTWFVDYDDAQCIATRNYGTDTKPLLLVLKPSPFGATMRLMVITPGYYSLVQQIIARVRFEDRPEIKTNTLRYSDDQRKMKIHSLNLPMQMVRDERRAKSVSINTPGADYDFALSDLAPVLAELEKCRVDLLALYNFNRPERIRQSASGDLQAIFNSSDYPRHAMREENQGTVAVSLLIDEVGKVADCSVDTSGGAASLDAMSCYVIQKRAEFKPAIGQDGKPVRSVHLQRIAWRIKR